MTIYNHYRLFIDACCILIATAYITLGAVQVPFHGDEATIIWKSHDFDIAVLQAKPAELQYQAPPQRNTEQHIRILTGNLSNLTTGMAWFVAGISPDTLNDQWVWGPDYAWNQANGHIPNDTLLKVSRLSSAWITAFSAVLLMAVSRLIAKKLLSNPLAIAIVGWASLFFYTIHPAILLNGRRAMFEGGFLLSLSLVAYGTFWLTQRLDSATYRHYLLFGILTGIALTSKHNAIFTVILLYAALLAIGLKRKKWLHLFHISAATISALLIFFILNPLWWSAPLKMPQIILEERQVLLDQQSAAFGTYPDWSAKITGLWQEALQPIPQYFEVADWATYPEISQEIKAYENTYLTGWRDGKNILIFALRLIAVLSGFYMLLQVLFKPSSASNLNTASYRVVFIVVVWLVGIVALTLLTTPLAWQRYYLQIQPVLIVTMGLGIGALIEGWLYGQSPNF